MRSSASVYGPISLTLLLQVLSTETIHAAQAADTRAQTLSFTHKISNISSSLHDCIECRCDSLDAEEHLPSRSQVWMPIANWVNQLMRHITADARANATCSHSGGCVASTGSLRYASYFQLKTNWPGARGNACECCMHASYTHRSLIRHSSNGLSTSGICRLHRNGACFFTHRRLCAVVIVSLSEPPRWMGGVSVLGERGSSP